MIGLQSHLLKVGKIVFFSGEIFMTPLQCCNLVNPWDLLLHWRSFVSTWKKGHNSTNECKLIITAIKQHCVFYDDDALLLKIFKKEIDLIPDHMDGPCPSITASFLRDSRPTGSSSRSALATSAWIFWASRIRKPHLPSNHKMCVVR